MTGNGTAWRRTHFERSNVTAITARRISNDGDIVRPMMATLIGMNHEAVALINRWTSKKQRVRRRETTVHLQRADERINWRSDAADLVRIDAVDKTCAAVGNANQIEFLRCEITRNVEADAVSARISYLARCLIIFCICPACSTGIY